MKLIEKIKLNVIKVLNSTFKLENNFTYVDRRNGDIYNNLDTFLVEHKQMGRRLFDLEYKDIISLNRISFEITPTPYCCGLFEIGNLYMHLTEKNEKNYKIAANIIDKYIETFKTRYFILNTNGMHPNAIYENVLPYCKYFQSIRSFYNVNSGRIVTTWISLNE